MPQGRRRTNQSRCSRRRSSAACRSNRFYPELGNAMLLCATEMSRRADMDTRRGGLLANDPQSPSSTSRRTKRCSSKKARPARAAISFPTLDVPAVDPGRRARRANVRAEIEDFPEVSEVEAIRHFTRLSTWNYAIDLGLYPLGSCTMKYNPRVNELVARLDGLAWAHPYQPESLSQGAMQVIAELEAALLEITGMDAITLQPAAGAHGELTGILLVRALSGIQGNPRKKILVPDSAHGTNPATASMAGYSVQNIKSNEQRHDGCRAARQVARRRWRDDVAALMVTNPNTLGIFEEDIAKVAEHPARQGRDALHGWREHERAGRHRPPRRFRRGRDAHQPAQDVLHSARRRRSRRRSGGHQETSGAVPARARASSA